MGKLTRRITTTLAVLGIAALAFAGTGGQLTGGGTGLQRVILSGSATQIASGSGITTNPLLVTWNHDSTLQGTGSAGSAAGVVFSQVPGKFLAEQVLTASTGTYTPTTGTTRIHVRMIGGGGGGGGAASSSGTGAASGGNSGTYLEFWAGTAGVAMTGGSFINGAGGNAGASTPGGGGNGGDTTLIAGGQTYTAKGGAGGPLGGNVPNGTVSFSNVAAANAAGTTAVGVQSYWSGNFGVNNGGFAWQAGGGGASPLGAGGQGIGGTATGANGANGGGGGGAATAGANNRAGGTGGSGVIVIDDIGN